MSTRLLSTSEISDPNPTPENLAWAAGFADGEACVSIVRQRFHKSNRRDTYRMRFDIGQNHLTVLQDFEKAVGLSGRLYKVKRAKSQNRDSYMLTYDGDSAFKVIDRLRPFLRRKNHEAELAFEFKDQCQISRHFGPKGCPEEVWKLREKFHRKMQSLK
jgi:hypothetical protein